MKNFMFITLVLPNLIYGSPEFTDVYDLWKRAEMDMRAAEEDSPEFWIAIGKIRAYDNILYLMSE